MADNEPTVFASLSTVLSLWWNGKLQSFQEIWWWIFSWALVSSLIVHGVAALMCFCFLYKHKQGRWYTLAIAAMGFLAPITGGVISSAVITSMYISLGWTMEPKFAMVWGAGQTCMILGLSFPRLLPTL